MTPTRYQSGETDVSGRISRIGDAAVRAVLYEGAHVILTKPVKGCIALKSWAMRIPESAAASRTIRAFTPVCDGLWLGDAAVKSRAGMKKAKVQTS